MKILKCFDKNQVQIGLNAHHATPCGIVCGVIASLILLAIAIVKIISVFRYDVLYLNYWRTEEISSLHLPDLQFRLTLYTTADPQSGSNNEQIMLKITPGNINLTGVSIKLYNQESNMGKIIDRKFYDLVACQMNKTKIQEIKMDEHYFCLPQVEIQVFGNPHDANSHYKRAYVKVQTNYSDLHQLIKQKRTTPNQKSITTQQQPTIDQFQAMMTYHFADKSINPYDHNSPLSTQSIKEQKFSALFSEQMCGNISTSLYFSSTNLTTDNNILPLSTESLKQFKQYWRYQPQYNQVAKKVNVAGPLQFFIIFNRAPFTSLYQRRYKRIDTALAQILALSSLTAILLKLLLNHYNKWSSRQYLLQQTTQRSSNSLLQEEEQQNIEQEIKYESNVRQYARSITKKRESEIEMERLEERRKRIDEIEKSGNLIQMYKLKQKLKLTEQKLGIIQKILLQDPHFNQLYKQQIHKSKSKSKNSSIGSSQIANEAEEKRRIQQMKEQKREQKQKTKIERDPLEEQLIINKESGNNLVDIQEQDRND